MKNFLAGVDSQNVKFDMLKNSNSKYIFYRFHNYLKSQGGKYAKY